LTGPGGVLILKVRLVLLESLQIAATAENRMRYDRFTLKAQESIQEAESLAHRFNHSSIEPDHILMALLEQRDGIIPPLLEKLGASTDELIDETQGVLNAKPKVYGEGGQVFLSPPANRVLHQAEQEAAGLKDEYTSTEHLLLALAEVAGATRES
jgi:ATP-dependent Clp protease ATP-binding subunit ClpB